MLCFDPLSVLCSYMDHLILFLIFSFKAISFSLNRPAPPSPQTPCVKVLYMVHHVIIGTSTTIMVPIQATPERSPYGTELKSWNRPPHGFFGDLNIWPRPASFKINVNVS